MSYRVLVIGGTGFLGNHLIQALLSANYEVLNFSRSKVSGRNQGCRGRRGIRICSANEV